jgi:alpha-glucosidase
MWANGPVQEDIRRRFIETRYRLLPYLYTVTEEDTHTGLPLLRPLFLEFPNAAADRHPLDVDLNTSGEFMVGPDLLVAAPAFEDKAGDYEATLPSSGWYDFWTGKKVEEDREQVEAGGLQTEPAAGPVLPAVKIHRELATLPVFVRPGAILPVEPLVQSTEETPVGPLTLRVFPGPECGGQLYQDDGRTFAYKQGAFLRMSFTCEAAANGGRVSIHVGKHEGSYPTWWKEIAVQVNGLAGRPSSVMVDGKAAKFTYMENAATIVASDGGNGIEIVLQAPGIGKQ